MNIENLQILSILDGKGTGGNKILVLEIKNGDVPKFLEYAQQTKGFIFAQKNTDEYGEYKFIDLNKSTISPGAPIKSEIPEHLPSIGVLGDSSDNVANGTIEGYVPKKEVEVIVGNQKTTMEFAE